MIKYLTRIFLAKISVNDDRLYLFATSELSDEPRAASVEIEACCVMMPAIECEVYPYCPLLLLKRLSSGKIAASSCLSVAPPLNHGSWRHFTHRHKICQSIVAARKHSSGQLPGACHYRFCRWALVRSSMTNQTCKYRRACRLSAIRGSITDEK